MKEVKEVKNEQRTNINAMDSVNIEKYLAGRKAGTYLQQPKFSDELCIEEMTSEDIEVFLHNVLVYDEGWGYYTDTYVYEGVIENPYEEGSEDWKQWFDGFKSNAENSSGVEMDEETTYPDIDELCVCRDCGSKNVYYEGWVIREYNTNEEIERIKGVICCSECGSDRTMSLSEYLERF